MTQLCVYVLTAGAFIGSLVLTMMLRRAAGSAGLIDVPNERSSHTVPTPRGGGLAIVISSMVAIVFLAAIGGVIPTRLLIALCGGGGAVAAVGFLDDRRSVPTGMRLIVHFIAATWAVAWVGPVSALPMGGEVIRLGALGYVLSAIAIVWFLNIFNFMDGIDGIAASEAVFICGATVFLSLLFNGSASVAVVACAIGAASVGFLFWNWPPAKIFMGDVGSGYLGFVIGVLALADTHEHSSALWSWFTLAGVFAVDSTVTLARRLMRGDQIALAHRTHAYQRLARRMGHAPVTALMSVVNLIWLLPCAVVSTIKPASSFWIALLALCPLVVFAVAVGAGQPE